MTTDTEPPIAPPEPPVADPAAAPSAKAKAGPSGVKRPAARRPRAAKPPAQTTYDHGYRSKQRVWPD
ncbi:hypothetical protein ThidrDRAFT_4018 [Thiorhodococcus drewsii AZ1]|uniref:Uncharacterized protein n=1 Tax=Thiorhodococcus drewsii AZ1 TaxID=765913 RepID=G2E6V5_9GAMM|nr:hypothetical protein [Thiorhodococcus drewsii]EGV28183.1 hypothetical protein ThidrDRAFT_4018 [Thiorhodococcus drewsii AZ1]